MTKTPLAAMLAVFACCIVCSAFAQEVTVSGLVDTYAGVQQYAGSQRAAVVNSGGMSTSWWGV